MAKLYAIYQQPKDPAAFDAYYFKTHVPLAKTIPGLRSYEVTRGDVMGMGGKHAVYLIATLGLTQWRTSALPWLHRKARPPRRIWPILLRQVLT